ncbi:hypothetical protein PybrP1_002971 [[Pythium] brassicae (nom. inval.)]|nr:hypothetical protein PybrP1_002971 [[Pythium] brassicae (nom. inval.)]
MTCVATGERAGVVGGEQVAAVSSDDEAAAPQATPPLAPGVDEIGGLNDDISEHAVASGDTAEMVSYLIADSCLKKPCFASKKGKLEKLVGSLWQMIKQEKRCTMLSGLVLCEALALDSSKSRRCTARQRKRFDYALPYVGASRKQIELGDISARPHCSAKKKEERSRLRRGGSCRVISGGAPDRRGGAAARQNEEESGRADDTLLHV